MFRKSLVVVFCTLLAMSASASDQLYKISFNVTRGDKAVASPTVVVHEGSTGSVEQSGPDGYKLSFVVTDAGDDKIKIAADFTSPKGKSSSTIIVKDGQVGSVSDGIYQFRFVASRHGS